MTQAHLAELVDRAFDYRGYVTVRKSDGSELVGFVYDRGPSYLEMFDETATRRIRVPLAEVVDIAFTGYDAARKSQEIWERRKGTPEPRDTPAWGDWQEARPVLLLVALGIELRSVARAMDAHPRGNRVRGRLSGVETVAIAVGLGGGARAALAEEGARLVVSCGFAGGLDDAASPGDVVLATAVRDESGESIAAPAELRQAASQALSGMRHLEGELICTSAVAATEEEKRALARPGAVAVDMESYPAACAARDAGVPWLALRTIVDPLASSLPPFARSEQEGYLWPALKHAVSGPGAAAGLVRLGMRAKKASAALEEAVRRLAPALAAAEARP